MRRLVAVVVALLVLPASAAQAGFSVGAATASTDPRPGERLCLGGYGACPNGAGRTMTGVRDPLHARALAFSDGTRGAILVTTTNIGLFASYKTPGLGSFWLRTEVARRTGLPVGSVLVQADHSHAGPDTVGIWGGVPPDYLRRLQAAAVDAAVRAWQAREPATVHVGTANGPGITSSYEAEPNLRTDDVFILLWATSKSTGRRIASLANYSPHATVLPSSNKGASGDWPEWAALELEDRYGGVGLGTVGTLGREDFGLDFEDQARARLVRLIAEATAAGTRVPEERGLGVRTVQITEPMAQPVLLLNHVPEGTIDAGGYDLSIDRDTRAPWLRGTVLSTFAGALRIGDVFVGVSPGESFPQLQFYLRDAGGVTGARAWMHLGATNDFLGYLVRPVDHYAQTFVEGATYLGGCPEEALFEATGIAYDGACPDHWTLMVSPTIGTHVTCTIQSAALALGFTSRTRDPVCAAYATELPALPIAGDRLRR